METRDLGGLAVPALGLGCMGMSTAYGVRDDAESTATILRALELGCTFFDSADVYGDGHNETLLGAALKGRRGEAIIATKVGNLGRGAAKSVDGSPAHVTAGCDASLRRLGMEVIDLFYLHRVDPDVPIEETVGAMSRLVEAGKVRFIGLSEAGAETLRRAHATHPIAALQSELSLWSRDVEAEILPACRALGVGFVAYAPLGRGFLSGTIQSPDALAGDDRRRDHPRFAAANIAANLPLVAALKAAAAELEATPAQVAIAWVLSRGRDVVAIPGAKRRTWLDENRAAASLTLAPAQVEALEAAFRPGAAAGARYPAKQLAALGL